MVSLEGVSLIYGQQSMPVEAVDNVSVEIGSGETCVMIGPSGCGKTSLLYLVAGLLSPSTGTIKIDGAPLSGQRTGTALILQDYGLFPWKTVRQNVELGLRLRGLSRQEMKKTVDPLMERMGLAESENRFPTQISGGQRQRVAIARSLAMSPDLLLMDEPFSSLDALTREELQRVLREIWEERRITIILVTHNIEEAVFLGQKILVFSRRPARMIEVIDNPLAGQADYRASEEYFHICNRVRQRLEVSHHGLQ